MEEHVYKKVYHFFVHTDISYDIYVYIYIHMSLFSHKCLDPTYCPSLKSFFVISNFLGQDEPLYIYSCIYIYTYLNKYIYIYMYTHFSESKTTQGSPKNGNLRLFLT